MSTVKPLPEGTINPQAKPVAAFISPGSKQVAKPAQVASVPMPKGIRTTPTGGTTYVQGGNAARDLAQALEPFAKQSVELATRAGLQYIDWRIDQGEEAVRAEIAAAQAALYADESTEVSQLDRAAAIRRVAAQDPEAGSLMAALDPYTEIGRLRGLAKTAALEVPLGMRNYVMSNRNQINLLDGANGLVGLQSLRAEYVTKLFDTYGLSQTSPGVQKYLLPEIEKVSEDLAKEIIDTSVKARETFAPRILSAQLERAIKNIDSGKPFTLNEITYNKEDDPEGYNANKIAYLERIIEVGTADAFAGSDRALRMLTATEMLKEKYKDDPSFMALLNQIKTQETIQMNGESMVLTLQGFDIQLARGGTSILKAQTEATKLLKREFNDYLAAEMLKNPERENDSDYAIQLLEQFIEDKGGEEALPPGALAELRGVLSTTDFRSEISVSEPLVAGSQLQLTQEISELKYDEDFAANVSEIRENIRRISEKLNDDGTWFGQTTELLNARIDDVININKYDTVITEKVTAEVTSFLSIFGGPGATPFLRTVESRYGYGVRQFAEQKLKEAMIEGEISQSQASLVVQEAIQTYRAEQVDSGIISELFEGDPNDFLSKQRTQETLRKYFPGASPSFEPGKSSTVPAADSGQTVRLINLDQIDSFPNRGLILRQYETRPILTLSSLREVISSIISTKEIPESLRKARFESGAPNLFDFLMKQIGQYGEYDLESDFSKEDLELLEQLLVSSGNFENNILSSYLLEKSHPRLAALGNWTDNMV
tara:strand:- start:279 stop:2594 length:2316 start_codon:yes stop_codon:yes gene_type:complete